MWHLLYWIRLEKSFILVTHTLKSVDSSSSYCTLKIAVDHSITAVWLGNCGESSTVPDSPQFLKLCK